MKKMSFLRKTDLFIRSLLFMIISSSYIILQSFISILGSPFPLKYRYGMITSFLAFEIWLLKVLCGINYEVEGLENIPKNRAGVILSKHQSTWETFFLPTIFYQPAIILKRELLWVPFFGWGAATVAPIAIDRSKTASAMDQIIKQGKECIADGRWALVFPEGTRIPVGKVGKYRSGGARLAVAAKAPVIPVAHDAGYYWPKRGFIKIPGTVKMVIGPVIETEGKTPDEVTAQAQDWIENTIDRIDKEKGRHK